MIPYFSKPIHCPKWATKFSNFGLKIKVVDDASDIEVIEAIYRLDGDTYNGVGFALDVRPSTWQVPDNQGYYTAVTEPGNTPGIRGDIPGEFEYVYLIFSQSGLDHIYDVMDYASYGIDAESLDINIVCQPLPLIIFRR